MCNAFWETSLGTGNQVLPSLGTRGSPFICEKRLHMKYLYDLSMFTCNIMNDLQNYAAQRVSRDHSVWAFLRKGFWGGRTGASKDGSIPWLGEAAKAGHCVHRACVKMHIRAQRVIGCKKSLGLGVGEGRGCCSNQRADLGDFMKVLWWGSNY